MSPFSALGRRGLIQGSTATVLGSVAMPADSRAEAAVPVVVSGARTRLVDEAKAGEGRPDSGPEGNDRVDQYADDPRIHLAP